MTDASASFFGGGGPAAAKFPTIGTTVVGTIAGDSEEVQQTEPDGTLKTWKNGDPMMQLVVPLQTADRDPDDEDDDGMRRLFVKGQMRTAIQQALIKAGKRGFERGATLSVTYTGDGEKSNPAYNAPKMYKAVYTPPSKDGSAFLGTDKKTPAKKGAAEELPPGMDPAVWADLTPDVQAALKEAAGISA